MKTKIKPNTRSPIFDAVHETVADLHRLGLIGKRKLRRIEALCFKPSSESEMTIMIKMTSNSQPKE